MSTRCVDAGEKKRGSVDTVAPIGPKVAHASCVINIILEWRHVCINVWTLHLIFMLQVMDSPKFTRNANGTR